VGTNILDFSMAFFYPILRTLLYTIQTGKCSKNHGGYRPGRELIRLIVELKCKPVRGSLSPRELDEQMSVTKPHRKNGNSTAIIDKMEMIMSVPFINIVEKQFSAAATSSAGTDNKGKGPAVKTVSPHYQEPAADLHLDI